MEFCTKIINYAWACIGICTKSEVVDLIFMYMRACMPFSLAMLHSYIFLTAGFLDGYAHNVASQLAI